MSKFQDVKCWVIICYLPPSTRISKDPFITAVINSELSETACFPLSFLLPSISKNPGPWVGSICQFPIHLPSKTPHLSVNQRGKLIIQTHTISTCFARKKTVCPEICFRTICVVNLPCFSNMLERNMRDTSLLRLSDPIFPTKKHPKNVERKTGSSTRVKNSWFGAHWWVWESNWGTRWAPSSYKWSYTPY